MTYNAEKIAVALAWSWKRAKSRDAWTQIYDMITGAELVTDDKDDKDNLMYLRIVATEHRRDYF